MAPHHVLVIGGSGKIAKLLTPLLLQRSWTVTSIIRNPDQVSDLQKLAPPSAASNLNILVRSVEDVQSVDDAKSILDEVKADYVVWSAGAGGKGPAERTFTVDRDAASHFIRASASPESGVSKFVMVSFLTSRLAKPDWWSQETFDTGMQAIKAALPKYYEAKIAADEVLYRESRRAGGRFAGICLRPGTLTDEADKGRIQFGKTPVSRGDVSRETVARVADALLAKEGIKSSWLDLVDAEGSGGEGIQEAVDRVVAEGVDCAEGEPFYGKD